MIVQQSQYIITAFPTTSGSTVTTTAVDNLKSAMAQMEFYLLRITQKIVQMEI